MSKCLAASILPCLLPFAAHADMSKDNNFTTACPQYEEATVIEVDNPFPYPEKAPHKYYFHYEIFGEINPENVSYISSALIYEDVVRSSDGVIFHIDSTGGHLTPALGLVGAMNQMPDRADTISLIHGSADSSASIIAFAAQTVYAAEQSTMLIHTSWTELNGHFNKKTTMELVESAERNDSLMRSAYRDAAEGIHDSCLNYLLNGTDHHFSSIDALKLGFVDYVIKDNNKAYTLR